VARDIPQETAGFCLDTGHTFCAGTDPTERLAKYADQLDYIHFTDIDCAKFDEVIGRRIRFFERCDERVMCPIAGAASTDPQNAGGSVADVNASRGNLRSVGSDPQTEVRIIGGKMHVEGLTSLGMLAWSARAETAPRGKARLRAHLRSSRSISRAAASRRSRSTWVLTLESPLPRDGIVPPSHAAAGQPALTISVDQNPCR
jgi:hypothetical protein